MEREIILTPTQKSAYEGLLEGLASGAVVVLRGDSGMGKTTILEKVHAAAGGAFLSVRQFMGALMAEQPAAIEEAFLSMIERGLATNDLVVLDDFDLIAEVTNGRSYPRTYLLDAALTGVLAEAGVRGKKLLFGVGEEEPWPLRRRSYAWEIGEFTPDDYACLCGAYLEPETASALDYAKIHRFAPKLNAHQLKNSCVWLRNRSGVETDSFIGYLKSQHMASNVELDEVQKVDWKDLKGVDDVIEALEAK